MQKYKQTVWVERHIYGNGIKLVGITNCIYLHVIIYVITLRLAIHPLRALSWRIYICKIKKGSRQIDNSFPRALNLISAYREL